jgi:hypothetical protein
MTGGARIPKIPGQRDTEEGRARRSNRTLSLGGKMAALAPFRNGLN